MLTIRKGGHRDLERYFPLMELDFDSEELISKIALHKGIINGSIELLVLFDEESNMELGYAMLFTKSIYGYAVLKYMAVMPWCRGKGIGVQLMRLINKRYAERQGIIAELTEFDDPDPDRLKKLRRFFKRFGYEELNRGYSIKGVRANLLVKPIKGSTDIELVVGRILHDVYSRFMAGWEIPEFNS